MAACTAPAGARLVKASGKPKIALVTGGASGIGRATSLLLAHHGARVIVGDLPSTRSRFDAHIAPVAGDKVEFQALDVTREDDWKRVMRHVVEVYGGLDVLVNNAGIYKSAIHGQKEPDLPEFPLDVWKTYFSVNVDGTFLGTREAIKLMRKDTSGESRSIINMSSAAGLVGFASLACYSATKGAVRLFTKSTALHCAKNQYNIRVNSVHPGGIDVLEDKADVYGAEAVTTMKESAAPVMKSIHPIGRAGSPRDIANAVLFLASEESSFMTGSEVVVDGGYTSA